MFVSSQQKTAAIKNDEYEKEMANSQHQYGEWQTPDKGEWVQSLEFVADHQDQL